MPVAGGVGEWVDEYGGHEGAVGWMTGDGVNVLTA